MLVIKRLIKSVKNYLKPPNKLSNSQARYYFSRNNPSQMNRPYLCFSLVTLLSVVFMTGRSQDNIAAEKQLIVNLNIFSGDTEKKYFNEIASTGKTDLLQLMLIAGNTNSSA